MVQIPPSVPVFDLAVIGAGVAGLTAARLLSSKLKVVVIESANQVGGLAWQLGCKATDECLYCGVCHRIQLQRELGDFSCLPFELMTNSNLVRMTKNDDGFHLVLNTNRLIIAQSILIATGIEPFDAHHASQYGYGMSPHIYTGFDIEKSLNEKGLTAFSSYQRIAFIQCVGSRNFKEKRGYCSQVCCRYALRIAENLRFQFPHLHIDMYYMDLQLLGGKKELLWSISQKRVHLIRHIPYRVSVSQGKPILLFEDEYQVSRAEYDAVILSIGMVPSAGTKNIAELLRVNIDESGFIKNDSQGKTIQDHVYVCGAASGPKDIETSIADGKKISHQILLDREGATIVSPV